MKTIEFIKLNGQKSLVDRLRLKTAIQAPMIFPESAGYDQVRSLWNAMIDRKPAVIIQAENAQDVADAVRFAAEHEILLALRSGGHSIAGKSSCNDGMLIDLRKMNRVAVDVQARTAKVGPGATLADIDAATQKHGLLVPTGINSTTGIAGLALGGGFGWTSGKFGLTIDNLIAAQVVTANGERVNASADENPDLFWALRGGGGNFGIVTEFEFRLHELNPEICAGLIVYPIEQSHHVLDARSELMADASDDLSCWAVMRKAPPLPFIPEDWHGKPVIILATCYLGPLEAGKAAIQALAAIGSPVGQMVSSMPFTGWQAIFDPFAEPGMRNYWKSQDVADLGNDAIELLIQAANGMPSRHCEIFIGRIDGKACRIDNAETPWPNRTPHFVINAHSRWAEAANDSNAISWARALHQALEAFSMGSRYINFIPEHDDGDIKNAYGSNYDRLIEIKNKWDPANLFRVNFNLQNGR